MMSKRTIVGLSINREMSASQKPISLFTDSFIVFINSPGHYRKWIYDSLCSDWFMQNQNIAKTAKGLRPREMASAKEIYVGGDVA